MTRIGNLFALPTAVAVVAIAIAPPIALGETYTWQEQQADVLPSGDIRWKPKPFRLDVGNDVRFIDYEDGDDTADGTTKATAWKHHPWDRNATGKAAEHSGVTTYIFRRGVVYRGGLGADESGRPGEPIILTASALDKNSPHYWGEGNAHVFGSRRLPAKWVKATEVDHPDRIPNPQAVWAIDLNGVAIMKQDKETKAYRLWMDMTGTTRNRGVAMPFIGLFRVGKDMASHRQHLARSPDWQRGNDNFALDYWHRMDDRATLPGEGKKSLASGFTDEAVLKGHPEDWFAGGYIWQQYAHFMGTPIPKLIEYETKAKHYDKTFKVYDPDKAALYTGSIYGATKGGLYYMIENLPQFLDAEEEFYFDDRTGMLYYIPPEGRNPNDMQLELTSVYTGLTMPSRSHILVNGLTFRYFDGSGVQMGEDVTHVTVRNCVFEDLLDHGVRYGCSNWRGGKPGDRADQIRITDCLFTNVASLSLNMGSDPHNNRLLGHVEILRNRIYNNGMRHRDNVQSSVEALAVRFPRTAVIAGNIVERSFGSGIQVFGGAGGRYKFPERSHTKVAHFPLTRILIFQNKTVDTALGVNDYGGFSLWQGGVQYCYNNNIGNSPGVMPAGIAWFNTPPTNLSYPLYLDGAYKIYSFNNIVWARSNDLSRDKYATKTPGYFMVFGFLNQLVNNTFYRTGQGVGGSAGHRNDVLGNVFAEVGYIDEQGRPQGKFIANDRTGDPSLVGGGDTGDSGRRGVPTLAFARNVFHGAGKAGRLLKPGRFGPDSPGIEAASIPQLAQAMQEFPIRLGQLGQQATRNPIVGKQGPSAIEDISEVDFRPSKGSAAIDNGVRYFVPWALYGTVGEWHFTENHADPTAVMDYAWYMAEPHYHRMMYEFVPTADLSLSSASLDDYVSSPSEDWAKGAVHFDGKRFARVTDRMLRADIQMPAYQIKPDGSVGKANMVPPGPLWELPEPVRMKGSTPVFAKNAVFTFPGEKRRTLAVSTENLLLEATLRTEGDGVILGKHDGRSGYQLSVDRAGKAVFRISAEGRDCIVRSARRIADGTWHHVLAEVDRKTGRMTLYLDGQADARGKAGIDAETSIDNRADFLVAKASDDTGRFTGAIDFLRVCHGTLADAQTTIEELHAWQSAGPATRDFAGHAPAKRRDAGALERLAN